MKRLMKRFIAIALTAVMTLGLTTAALADDSQADDPHFTYTNIKEDQPDLYVTKTASSALEGYTVPDAEFTFVLKWDQDGDGYLEFADTVSYFVYDESGQQIVNPNTSDGSYRTTSTGRFTLKAGQYARFEWAGTVDYEVTELETENFIQTEPAGSQPASGTIPEEGAIVNFENLYIPIDDGGGGGGSDMTLLAVRKDITWPSGVEIPDLADAEFTFQVSIDGEPYTNEAYTIYDTSMTTQEGTGRTDGDGMFTISGDQLALFEEVPVGVDYTVTEAATDGWRSVGSPAYAGSTVSPIVYTYFTNTITAFSVEKERADGITGTDGGEFTFTLSGQDGSLMGDVTYYLYDADGDFVTSEEHPTGSYTTSTDGTFTLQAGQKAVFTGIAEGTKYKITETGHDGFAVNEDDGFSGTVESSIEEYKFVNTKLTDITIKKYGKEDSVAEEDLLGGAEFTIYQLREGGDSDNDDDWVPYPDSENATKTTGNTENSETYGTLTFTDLPAGTYKIIETKTPAGYITAGEPIIVTLPYTMTEEEIEDGKVDVNDPDFKGVYSEQDGVYYFYDLTYEVSNTAVLVMPNTGGNAWIIIVLAICGAAAALVGVYTYRRRHSGKERVRA